MPKLSLFQGYGIELEYMIVESKSLNILPLSDEVMRAVAGRYTREVNTGIIGWSNEFVLHVLELRNIKPIASILELLQPFQNQVTHINGILREWCGQLMPTAMHPWMNPKKETHLWHHQNRHIYETYNRIFDCMRHGWANIQSTQINISFDNDDEFGRLHAALRLLLPIIPAIAASSPIVEGNITDFKDNRLFFYLNNQKKVPSIAGMIVPEAILKRRDYKKFILEKMYKDVSKHDPEGILKHEWLNSRGAIPRFDRSAIEIRISDAQECPLADIAISIAIAEVLKALVKEQWIGWHEQALWKTAPLFSILKNTIKNAESALINDSAYLKVFGYPKPRASAKELWQHLIQEIFKTETETQIRDTLSFIVENGTLSKRILKAVKKNPSRKRIHAVYERLCNCLAEGKLFSV
ncbi:MAG: glutamate-cysteine ligase family protein [Nitrospirota bacterium]